MFERIFFVYTRVSCLERLFNEKSIPGVGEIKLGVLSAVFLLSSEEAPFSFIRIPANSSLIIRNTKTKTKKRFPLFP